MTRRRFADVRVACERLVSCRTETENVYAVTTERNQKKTEFVRVETNIFRRVAVQNIADYHKSDGIVWTALQIAHIL